MKKDVGTERIACARCDWRKIVWNVKELKKMDDARDREREHIDTLDGVRQ